MLGVGGGISKENLELGNGFMLLTYEISQALGEKLTGQGTKAREGEITGARGSRGTARGE